MGTIISLHDEAHAEAQQLLPWYANHSLAESERARVEAHLAECDACRADLETEALIGAHVVALAPEVERGWADMQTRMRAAADARHRSRWLRRRAPIGWAVAGQAVAAVVIVALMLPWHASAPIAAYRTLGSAATATPGNVIVMFAKDSSEGDLRAALARSGARIVDGPTVSGAYVLRVGDDRRERALATLRADAHVSLAEPIDSSAPR